MFTSILVAHLELKIRQVLPKNLPSGQTEGWKCKGQAEGMPAEEGGYLPAQQTVADKQADISTGRSTLGT